MTQKVGISLETLFTGKEKDELKKLNLIIKADVRGSVGPIATSLEKLSTNEISINIIHEGVGAITDSDVSLAETADAIIIGFNVRPTVTAKSIAEKAGVEIRSYKVIYDIINDIEKALKGLLEPEFKEIVLGRLEIREVFKASNIGTVGGSYVIQGVIERSAQARLLRDGVVIFEGKIASLKRFKEDVREVKEGFECGIKLDGYDDIKEGDEIECFKLEEVAIKENA
jgi:translation initiation factor IF-2